MHSPDSWLAEFGERQLDTDNPGIYWAAQISLLVGVVALLWALPVPDEFLKISPALNWGTLFLMAALVYYFIISISLGVGMVPFTIGIAVLQIWLANRAYQPAYLAATLIGVGIGGLYFCRYASGGLRAALRDVQLIMIAPIWLLSNIYRRIGIPV